MPFCHVDSPRHGRRASRFPEGAFDDSQTVGRVDPGTVDGRVRRDTVGCPSMNWSSGLDAKGRPIPTPQPPGQPTYPGNQGGTNWYVPSLQPTHGPLLLFGVGELRHDLPARGGRVQAGPALHRRRIHRGRAGARRADHRHRPPRPHQQLDRRSRQRRRDGHRPRDRSDEVEAAPARRERRRHADDRARICSSRAAARATSWRIDARTGAAAVESASLGGQIVMGPITYMVDGKQHVSVIAGHTLVTFAPARLSRTAQGCPFQRGGRFSRKAPTPSWPSSVKKSQAMACPAIAYASGTASSSC